MLIGIHNNSTVHQYIIIGFICSINLLQSSFFSKFNTFINILTTFLFQFISSYPNSSIKILFGSWICCSAILPFKSLFKSNHSIQIYLTQKLFYFINGPILQTIHKYSAIQTKKTGFSIIQQSYTLKVINFYLFITKESNIK